MKVVSTPERDELLHPVCTFLSCRSPAEWVEQAAADIDSLLLDHATLELKAAQQAQKLIWKYGAAPQDSRLGASFRARLIDRMSRLAREELRHFEQVVAIIRRRGGDYRAISASRYAGALHALADTGEPGALVDSLIVGAIIEARSCERFASLIEPLGSSDPVLARFYGSLLRAEARHFEDYLALAREAAGDDPGRRVVRFLERDRELIESADRELRFLGGVPAAH